MKINKKVVVAMSGGVDSSLAAIILKKKGYDVVGVTLKLVDGSRCCDVEAVSHAKIVCEKFSIPHHVFDVSKKFDKTVIAYYLSELSKARTPNPCVICNRFLKFDQLFKIARKLGASHVATGHYSKLSKSKTGELRLKKGADRDKDQSYYLSFLKKDLLPKIIFPLGKYKKNDIYKMAKKEKLDFLVSKKQSQDLCFIDDKLRAGFVKKNVPSKKGEIVNEDGCVLGEHDGLCNYTLGQRKGLFLSGGPFFTVGINRSKNRLVVSKNIDDPKLFSKTVKLKKINLLSSKIPKKITVMAKIRYRQPLSKAVLGISDSLKCATLEFEKPQRAVTKGQIAVFYKGDICLGGGIIK